MFTADRPMIGFHLDLKYAMPSKRYLRRRWLPHLAKLGINALLMEYEDKFPFRKYPFVCKAGAFTPEELRDFLKAARDLGVTPIPLVQTLAHLEFALGHRELAHLREQPDIHTHICPSNPEAMQFVHDLIDEVQEYHPGDPYFHLGADEAHFAGSCPQCKPRKDALGPVGYWVEHLTPLCNKIIAQGQRPIVWDDIYWPDPSAIHQHHLPQPTILHCWDYVIRRNLQTGAFCTFNPSGTENEFGSGDKIERFRNRAVQYRKHGQDIITGPCLNWGVLAPMHDHCIENTAAWAQIGFENDSIGMINTAWQSFGTPLPTYWTNTAATTAVMRKQTDNWETAFLAQEFGVELSALSAVPGALEDLGQMWEQRINDLRRPIAPIIFGYMDMVLWWPTFDMRSKRAAYPLDKSIINFKDMYQRKLYVLRTDTGTDDIRGRLSRLIIRYDSARAVLAQLASQAKKQRDEAQLLALFAQLKWVCAVALEHLVYGTGDRATIAADLKALKQPLRRQLGKFMEPESRDFLFRCWWEPTAAALGIIPL